MKINKPELFSKILINVLFISIFISLFFFTYGASIEKKVVENQMDFLCINLTDMIKLGGKEVNQQITDAVKNITIPDLSEEDQKSYYTNKNIMM